MVRKFTIALLAATLVAGAGTLAAQTLNSGLRGPAPLNDEGPAPPIMPNKNTAEREVRNYPEQPPVIPHSIDGYQIDLNGNKCLSCHARSRTRESQAPMISITHFSDRDGQFLAQQNAAFVVGRQQAPARQDVQFLHQRRIGLPALHHYGVGR